MKTRWSRYVWMDIRRAFCIRKMPVSVVGICLAFSYSSYEPEDVVSWVSNLDIVAVLVMAVLLFAIYPYATAFCEDQEYRYDMQMILRGNSFSYASSKLVVVFLSSATTMLMGFFLTVFRLYLKYGLPDSETLEAIYICQGNYYKLLMQEQYILYFICAGLQLAGLAGTLAVVGLMGSLFIQNRMLVYILPIAFLYIEDIVVQRFFGWEQGSAFSLKSMAITTLNIRPSGQGWELYYIELLMILLCSGVIICWKIGRR